MIWGSVVILVISAGITAYINLNWKPFLTRQISEAILTSTDSLYSISFKDIHVNILTGNVSLDKIVFKPNPAVYQKLVSKGIAPRHLYSLGVTRLSLNHLHPLKVYFKRELEMSSIVIDNPVLRMTYQKVAAPQDTVMDKRTAYERLSKYLRSIKVDNIMLEDVDFKYIDKTALRYPEIGLKNLHIQIAGLLIDSASQFNRSKLYYTDDISVSLRDYSLKTTDSLYEVKVDEFAASTRKQFARIEGLHIIPRYGEMEFAQKLQQRKSRYAMRFDEVLLEKINFRIFNTQRRLLASKLTLSSANIGVFTNAEMPQFAEDKTQNLPQYALKRFNLDTRIDTVKMQNIRVSYSEYNPESQRKGTIFFNDINGSIINLTNNADALRVNHYCRAELTSLLMGRGRFNLAINFDLTQPDAAFKYHGELGLFNSSKLNKIIKPLGLVEIRSGTINSMKFDAAGSSKGTRGTLAIDYRDLKIKLLEKNSADSRLKKMRLASMFANIIILKTDNPEPNQRLRVVGYKYQRDLSVSFFGMLWKGLFDGIKQSVGLDEATQIMIQKKLQQVEAERADRKERKLKRFRKQQAKRERLMLKEKSYLSRIS